MTYHSIDFTKSFTKQYTKLSPAQKRAFQSRLILFMQDPFNKILRNHGLKGKYLGYRSIDIQGDLRALYTVHEDVIVIFGLIGTHSQLYG